MIGRTNVGGGGGSATVAAFINVTYPAGSTCICTDGSKTLTLKDTSGQGLFYIPYLGRWTVKCYDGSDFDSSVNKKSEVVEITSEGQSVNVELSYTMYLYKNGDECVSVTGGWSNSGYTVSYPTGTLKNENGVLTTTETVGSTVPGGGTVNKVNVSNYKKLIVKGTWTKQSANYKFGLWDTKSLSNTPIAACLCESAGDFVAEIQLNNVSSEYYVATTGLGSFSEVALI